MNKAELINAVAATAEVSKKDAEAVVSATLDAITAALTEGEKVQLVGFGSFEVKKRAARIGRNPKTKESIEIPASVVPVFKAGKSVDDPHGIREEVGDTLFMAAKVAQSFQVDPEDALHRACDKFDARFRLVEEAADKPLADYSQEELLALWRAAKEQES